MSWFFETSRLPELNAPAAFSARDRLCPSYSPLRDFSNFVMTVLRLSMAFDPLRVVLPLFFGSGALFIGSLARDIYYRNLADTTIFLFLFSMLILMIGLLADLINRKLPW